MSIREAKHVHFIGIGGIGISALAKMMHHRGVKVSGINDSESPKTLDELRNAGIPIHNVPGESWNIMEADAYVYSVAWEGRAPKVLEAARATGKPVLTYFEALGEVAKEYKVVAISGTHGKTTTTAMTAQALIAAGLDPTVIVGSLVNFGDGKKSNFRASASTSLSATTSNKLLVVEACEYKRHFLHFHPYIFAVTNIELDHPDYYKDLADVESAFAEAASQAEIVLTTESIESHLLSVPELKVPGEHNRKNAALALAICDALDVDLEKAKEALENFTGSWRRFEYKGETSSGAKVYDDYAHHPTEIRATLSAIKQNQGNNQRIIAVFEPHMFSRTRTLFNEFTKSFEDADEVIIAPIYPAREDPIVGITAQALAQAISQQGKNAQHTETLHDAVKIVDQLASSGDTILFMSAGDIYKEIPSIIKS